MPLRSGYRRHRRAEAVSGRRLDPQWKSYLLDRAFHKKFGIHRHDAGIKTVV